MKQKHDAEYELGRYKKKVETQEKQLKELRDELEVSKVMTEASNAIVTAILYAFHATKDKPLVIDRSVVGAAVKGQYEARSAGGEDQTLFRLYYAEKE